MIEFDYLQDTVDATVFTYEKMLASNVTKLGELSTETAMIKVKDITALIGFTGEVIGSMLISMKTDVALKTISKFDGLEEIVNIIAGAAAARFKVKAGLGLPTILIGDNQRIRGSEESPWKLQTVQSEALGEFLLGITLKEVQ